MNDSSIIELLLTAAARIAAQWVQSSADERAALEERARCALAAMQHDAQRTAEDHDARTRQSDEALQAAEERRARSAAAALDPGSSTHANR